MPTFDHRFEDALGNITSSTVNLSVREVENAGLFEILQAPGAALGNWRILDALLDGSVSTFSFLEPLGHAREVKTAVSGLFGRFVARAYATRYLGLTKFDHVRKPPMRLSGVFRGSLKRVPGTKGDLPDWVAWGPASGMAIIEAKGCHDVKSPEAALGRAFTQARRAEIRIGKRLVPFKRYAIATRWGFTNPTATQPMLWVKDPQEDGELSKAEADGFEVGMLRRHAASLLAPLGHGELAKLMLELAQAPHPRRVPELQAQARRALAAVPTVRAVRSGRSPEDALIGGYVSRAGPLEPQMMDNFVSDLLSILGLQPAFVGIERGMLKRAIEGIPRDEAAQGDFREDDSALTQGTDGDGSWIIRLGDDGASVRPGD